MVRGRTIRQVRTSAASWDEWSWTRPRSGRSMLRRHSSEWYGQAPKQSRLAFYGAQNQSFRFEGGSHEAEPRVLFVNEGSPRTIDANASRATPGCPCVPRVSPG